MDETTSLRRILQGLFFFGSLGTATELVLLEHTAEPRQLIPLVALVLGCVTVAAVALRPRRGTVRAFQLLMVAFLIAGAVGVGLHFTANMEFERELNPGAGRGEVLWGALKGAIPALAPGTMMLLGALGLTATYGHPALRRQDEMMSSQVGGM